MTVPTPLKAWDMLMRISAYRGGPQTLRYPIPSVSDSVFKLEKRKKKWREKETCDIRIRSRFQRTQTIPDYKNRSAESAE